MQIIKTFYSNSNVSHRNSWQTIIQVKRRQEKAPCSSWSFGKYLQEPLLVESPSSLQPGAGKSFCCHTNTAPQGSQAQQSILSVSHITGEENIIPKSFLADSEIKPGPAHKAQQMSQEPAVHLKYVAMAKPSPAVSHLKPFHSWGTPDSANRAVALAPPARYWKFNMVYYHLPVVYHSIYNKRKTNFSLTVNLHHGTEEKALFWLVIWTNLTRKEQKKQKNKRPFLIAVFYKIEIMKLKYNSWNVQSVSARAISSQYFSKVTF